MPTCPDCGLPDQEGSCDHCGTTLPTSETTRDGDRAARNDHDERQTEAEGDPPEEDLEQLGTEPADGQSEETTGDDEGESRFSRRQLLGAAGGAGAVAVAGGWYTFLRGPTGAKAVAADYVEAIADNDWEKIASLYHEDAPVVAEMDGYDSYDAYLEAEDRLQAYEDPSPSVDELIVFTHVTDVSQGAAEAFFWMEPEDVRHFDEAKQIIAIVDVDASSVGDGSREEYLAGDTTNSSVSTVVVSGSGGWQLWQGGPPF